MQLLVGKILYIVYYIFGSLDVCGLCMCAAVKVVRDSSSGQFVKISSTRVERTTIVLSINASAIDVRHVVISAVCRLE